MKKILALLSIVAMAWACGTVPITGRKQLNLLPSSELQGMSLTQYSQFLKDNPPLPDSDPRTQQIKRIGQRIAKSCTEYLKSHGQSKRVANFKWEFNVVDDPTLNAWCMPGGKVVFYTGILPICKDDEGIAVVMGHEVAHAVAQHGNERMSQGLVTQLGGIGLALAIKDKPAETQNIFSTAYGLGSPFAVILPFSRKHESEADYVGVLLAADAGYDPRESIKNWQRMAQMSQGAPPEFMSTHPNPESRINKLQERMSYALNLTAEANKLGKRPRCK